MGDFLPLFRAGVYPQGTVTISDLEEVVNGYDIAVHRAPLTINHDSYMEALGFVAELKLDGDLLLGRFEELDDDVYTLSKKFRKPSIEISPLDGKAYLRAVSLTNFPGVKGLPDLKFSDFHQDGYVFSDIKWELNKDKKEGKAMNLNEVVLKFAEANGLNITDPKFSELALNTLADKLQKAEEQVKLAFSEKCNNLINNAIMQGKIKPAQKESFISFAEKDFENTVKLIDSFEAKLSTVIDTAKPVLEGQQAITYRELLKDPSLAKKFSDDEIASMRIEYMKS